jgi:hypothetical protein
VAEFGRRHQVSDVTLAKWRDALFLPMFAPEVVLGLLG